MNRNYDVITFSQATLILRGPREAIFADIIKILTMFFKTIIKDPKLCIKTQSTSVFLHVAKFTDIRWKTLMSAELKGCVTWFIYFLDLPQLNYNCAKFHHYRIYVTDFMERGLKDPPYSWTAPKKPILNRVKSKKKRLALTSFHYVSREISLGNSKKLICIDQSRFYIFSHPRQFKNV